MQTNIFSRHFLICFFAFNCILFFSSPNSYSDSKIEVLTKHSSRYNELIGVAAEWKNAILTKNFDVLLSYALPGDQKIVSDHLKDKDSKLYHHLYDDQWNRQRGSRSYFDILNSAKKLKTIILAHKDLINLGGGVTIYYYDEDKLKLKFPLDDEKGLSLVMKGEIINAFFYKFEGKWYVSYEL